MCVRAYVCICLAVNTYACVNICFAWTSVYLQNDMCLCVHICISHVNVCEKEKIVDLVDWCFCAFMYVSCFCTCYTTKRPGYANGWSFLI